jgi:ABC-type transport system substrate-binding protein
MNSGGYEDAELDGLYEKQKRTIDPAERLRALRAFETRVLGQGYASPLFWWQRLVVHWRQVKGWHVSPNQYINQDLTEVWLDE